MMKPVTVKRVGLIVPLLFMAILPWSAQAALDSADSVMPDISEGAGGSGSSGQSDGLPPCKPKHPWQIFRGVPSVSSLAFLPADVMPVACRQLEKDHWEIYDVDSARGKIVTRWKPMHHALVWLFMGHVNARCTVTMERVGPNLTRMTFQANLASRKDLHDNPMIGRAERAYAKAARDYATEVRDYLDTHHRLSSLEPFSPR